MRTTSLPISCWAAEDIPAIKGENLGYEALTNVELLSIIIGSGTQDCNAVESSRIILNQCGNNLAQLAKASPQDLATVRGLGKVKVSRILACMELGKRRESEPQDVKPELSTATRAYNHYRMRLCDLDHEEFWVSYLNTNYRLIKDVRISIGGITETAVDVRVIMREAVLCNATIIVCVHNHPSGRLSPSKYDDQLTTSIKNACQTMRIHFQDHVIVTDGAYYSYHENGKI